MRKVCYKKEGEIKVGKIYRFLSERTLDNRTGFQYQYITQMKNVTTLHDNDFCEWFLISYGEVNHECNGRMTRLCPGDMMLIRAQDQHCYHPIPRMECGLFNLAFATSILKDALSFLTGVPSGGIENHSAIFNAKLPPVVHLDSADQREYAQAIQQINTFSEAQYQDQGIYARQFLIRLLAQHFLKQTPPAQHPAPQWLERLCKEMQRPERFTQGITAMLEICPYTKEHLYRQFQKSYHETPGAFLHRLRLSYAANLLAHTDSSIAQIALDAGYDNLSYFYQRFRCQFSMTPQEYRRLTRRDAFIQSKPGIDKPQVSL